MCFRCSSLSCTRFVEAVCCVVWRGEGVAVGFMSTAVSHSPKSHGLQPRGHCQPGYGMQPAWGSAPAARSRQRCCDSIASYTFARRPGHRPRPSYPRVSPPEGEGGGEVVGHTDAPRWASLPQGPVDHTPNGPISLTAARAHGHSGCRIAVSSRISFYNLSQT